MAVAQIISPFGTVKGKMTAKDRQMMDQSLDRLLKQQSAGKTVTWQNSASGNSETLKLNRVFSQKGYPCRTVTHRIKLQQENDVRQYVVTYCNVDGAWKIAP